MSAMASDLVILFFKKNERGTQVLRVRARLKSGVFTNHAFEDEKVIARSSRKKKGLMLFFSLSLCRRTKCLGSGTESWYKVMD
jgi:hypothetical protein